MKRSRGPPKRARADALLGAAQGFAEAVRLEAVLEQLARSAVELAGASTAAAGSASGRTVVLKTGVEATERIEIPGEVTGDGLARVVMTTGRSRVAVDAEHHELVSPVLQRALGFTTAAAVPVLGHTGRAVGWLQAFSAEEPQPFDDETVQRLEALARVAAGALERAEDYERECEDGKVAAERFRTLAESTSDFLWEVDAQVRYTYCSPRTRELLGYEPAELIGKTPFDLMPEAEVRRLRPMVERVFAEGRQLIDLENVNLRKDGTPVVLQTSGAPFRDRTGALLGYRGVDRDVTAQREAVAQLRRHAELEHLLTTIAQGFINVEPGKLDEAIMAALGDIGRFVGADRCYIIRFSEDGQSMSTTHEWRAEGIEPGVSSLGALPVSTAPWAIERHLRGEMFEVPRREDMPPEAASERDILERLGVQSLIAAPLKTDDEVLGAAGFSFVRTQQAEWPEQTVVLLRVAGAILASALVRQRSARELEQATSALTRSEAALGRSRMMLQLVLDTIPVRVFWKNREGVYLGCNQSLALDAGVSSPAEVVGKTDFEMPWKPEAAHFRADDRVVVTTGREKLGYREQQTQRDRRITARTSKVPLRDPSGRIVGVLGTYEDITEQVRREEALEESEARLRQAVLYAPHPSMLYAEDGELLLLNEAWLELSGYAADELACVKDWLRKAHGEAPDEDVRRIYAPTRREQGEHEIRTKTGSLRVWDFSSTPLGRLPDGRRIMLTMAADVTERQRAEEQVRQLNEELEERVLRRTLQLRSLAIKLTQMEQQERRRIAHVLHESLQQMLVGAKLSLGTLERATTEAGRSHAARTARMTIDKALQLSRSLTVELRPPVLYELGLTPAIEWLGRQMKSRHRLDVSIVAGPGADPGSDAARIVVFEAVRELLLNVVKHSGAERAEITLARDEAGHVHVTVQDHGCGFDPSALSRDDSSGFGLFGIRERIAALGGRMRIVSRPGDGTAVHMTLPAGVKRSGRDDIEGDETG